MDKAEFDFVVAERPEYLPKSGPPLAPISLKPAHDKKGIIVADFEAHHQLVYVVSWPDAPQLRMTARSETVLDYVSDRTLEDYEYQRTLKLQDRGPGSKGGQNASETRDDKQPKKKGKPGRKRKHAIVKPGGGSGVVENSNTIVAIGPTSRVARKSIEEPEPVFTSPQRPTLSSPSKQRGLADMMESEESEGEEELSTDIAIEAQLNSTMEPHPRSTLRNDFLPSSSPGPSSVSKGKQRAFTSTPRDTRSSSRQVRNSFSRSVSSSTNDAKRQKRAFRDDSMATSSSKEAGKIYEVAERKKGTSNTPPKMSTLKSSHFSQYSSLAKKEKEAASSAQAAPPKPVDEEEDEEDVYEVDAILDETQYSVGKKNKQVITTYYLIKWVGDWPLSWEPAENVGQDAIDDYETKKKMGFIVVGEAGAAFDAALEAEAVAMDQDEKDKQAKGGNGEGEEVRDKLTRSNAKQNKRPAQGQVIDDDDGSEYDS